MKVCQLLYSGLGGHGSVAFSIIDGDDSNESYSIIFYGIEDLIEDYKKRCVERNIIFQFIKKTNGLDLKSYFKVFKSLKKMKPDAIILHSSSIIFPVWIYSFLFGIKLISVEHTPVIIKTRLDWIFSFINHLLANKTILLTEAYFDAYKKKLPWIWMKKISIIPNGIDTNIFKNREEKKLSKVPIIGMLSRLSKSKDHQTLILAIKILIDKGYDIQLKLAGDGESRKDLEKLVSSLNLNAYIDFLGLIQEEEIPDFFSKIDIYAHSSISETMSTSIMQALSCGKPMVVADIIGNSELIRPNETALLFKARRESSLAEKIESLILDDSLSKKLSVNARSFALSNLSQEKMSKAYKNFYK